MTNTPTNITPVDVPDRNLTNLFSPSLTSGTTPSTSNFSNLTEVISPAPSNSASTQLPAGLSLDPTSLGIPAASFSSTAANINFTQALNTQLGVGDASPTSPNIGAASPISAATLQSAANLFNNAFATQSSLGPNNIVPSTSPSGGADPWDRVKLRYFSGHPMASYPGMLQPLAQTSGLVWLYKPSVQISSNVDYDVMSLTHSIQEIHTFMANRATQISIAGQFVSQDVNEAMYALSAIHFMRSVSKMSFGTEIISPTTGLATGTPIGSPPPVILLSGYGNLMFNDIPVIVTNFSLDLPADVDYIEVPSGPGYGTKIPVSFSLQAQLVVQHAPQEMRQFNVDTYTTAGDKGWW